MATAPYRIIGVDPGSRYTGYGIIEKYGSRLVHIESGVIRAVKKETLEEKLELIFQELSAIIEKHRPQSGSIERIFHSVNPHSSLILGHARGVALLAFQLQKLGIYEYAPTEVKSAVVGVGRASKEQVQNMVQILLNQKRKMSLDESDALAIAICHAHTQKSYSIRNT
ncbi:MAG: crossover junction endodeoxyribonuclease RuvC [bacterium]|jgi:crossover junction endodeoxyribonuclease RuvC